MYKNPICIITQERLFFNLLLPLAIQRYILFIPFKGINPGNAVLHAAILHKAGRCQASAVIDGKQHFLVIPVRRRREYFLAGQLAEIRPHVQGKGFCYLCRVAVAVGDVTFDIDIDFLVFQLHSGFPPLYRRRVFRVMLIQPYIAVKQCRCAVYALFGRLVLDGYNIAVPVRLYARVGQTPFQHGIIVVNHFICKAIAGYSVDG